MINLKSVTRAGVKPSTAWPFQDDRVEIQTLGSRLWSTMETIISIKYP